VSDWASGARLRMGVGIFAAAAAIGAGFSCLGNSFRNKFLMDSANPGTHLNRSRTGISRVSDRLSRITAKMAMAVPADPKVDCSGASR